jgi:uncharacterized BrkB/YihY/UPF0761 family membrane protein
MSRLFKAALLAPIIFTLFLFLVLSAVYGQDFIAGQEEGMSIFATLLSGALLLTNLLVFLLGWPYYRWLKAHDRVTLRNLLIGGFAMPVAMALLISLYLHSTNLYQIGGQALIYGACGLLVTGLIWHIGIRAPKG